MTDLYSLLNGAAAITSIASAGVFWRQPKKVNTFASRPYIVFTREDLGENDVREQHRVQIIAFAQNTTTLEQLTQAIRDTLRGITEMNGNQYYNVAFVNQVDGNEILENGYYYNILNYFFSTTDY